MPRTIGFYLDENVRRFKGIAKALRSRGIEVRLPAEVELLEATDLAHWQYVCDQRLVLVTTDEDFLTLASQTANHPGIVYYKQGTRSIGHMIGCLSLIWELLDPIEMQGMTEFIPKS